MSKKPVALIIMDGFGYNPDSYGNAICAIFSCIAGGVVLE